MIRLKWQDVRNVIEDPQNHLELKIWKMGIADAGAFIRLTDQLNELILKQSGEQYADIRNLKEVELLDNCKDCGNEYAIRMHLRHKCGPCRNQEMDEIFSSPAIKDDWNAIWEHWSTIWRHFDRLTDSIFKRKV